MGTRADFYVGNGDSAEWLGSIAWDGYPDDSDLSKVFKATSEDNYRTWVKDFLASRDDATHPEEGWPWPWEDSGTTDYAYSWIGSQVVYADYGNGWFDQQETKTSLACKLPDMSSKKNIAPAGSNKSGIMVFG